MGQVTGERYGSLKNIPHRTLVVNGHDDIMVPTVNSFVLQQKTLAVQLMLFPDSGHGSHFQFPEEFAEAAAHFLAAKRRSEPLPAGQPRSARKLDKQSFF